MRARSHALPSGHHGRVVDARQNGSFKLTETHYRPLDRIPPHTHELPAFCFILNGHYQETFGSTVLSCRPNGVVFRPPEITHADMFGRDGARCLIVEPSAEWLDKLSAEIALPSAPVFLPGRFSALANRLQDELRWSDACTRVSVEGLALELAAAVSRTLSTCDPMVPAWLSRAREYLEVHYRRCPELSLVARLVGVHPVHLIRVFRQHYKCTPGQFLRQLRLEAAADALAQSEKPLLEIALDAGFADQPHFTKTFRKFSGQTPGEYRRARRGAKR
jgi:AraC family transcriptional regulator